MQKKLHHLFFRSESIADIFLRINLILFFMLITMTPVLAKPSSHSSKRTSYNSSRKKELQQTTVSGTVSDQNRVPMAGVTVVVKGTTAGTTTDALGKYTLANVPQNATLVFTFIGMTPQEVPLNGQTRVDVIMKETSVALEEVVVVGYGSQKKESIVGSIVQTKNEDLKKAGGVTNLKQALTGQLPGVTTITSTGEPGGSGTGNSPTTIFIRGLNTWNGGQPLILVDGVERSMDNVDVNEVQNISVLKDASATAVFGVKGANGVILITTKRGSLGKPKISFSYNTTALALSKLPKTLDAYETFLYKNEAIEREVSYNSVSWGDYTPYQTVQKYKLPQTPENAMIYPNVDWPEAMFKKLGWSQHGTLNLEGGTNFVNYFGSLSYSHEGDMFKSYDNHKGYTPSFAFNRFNFRSNLDFKVTKTTNFKVDLAGYYSRKDVTNGFNETNAGTNELAWAAAYGMPPDAEVVQFPNGRWGLNPAINTEVTPNPIAVIYNLGILQNYQTQLNTDFALDQKLDFITQGLSARASLFYDNTLYTQGSLYDNSNNIIQSGGNTPEQYIYSNLYTGPDQDPSVYTQLLPIAGTNQFDWVVRPWTIVQEAVAPNNSVSRRMMYQFMMNYGRKFGKNNVGAMGMVKREQYANGSEFPHFREDWVFRATYDYDTRYLFETNGAYNGSEQFGPDYRFAFFPSLALGWVVSNEEFFKKVTWVNRLKLRYSIGNVGDDNTSGGRWLYSSQYTYGSTTTNGSAYLASTYNVKSPYKFYTESIVGNPALHWEKSRKVNYGFEIGLLKDLISVNYDYFTDDRTDIIIAGSSRTTIPSFFGIAPPTANVGHVKAHGYELEIKLAKATRDWQYWATIGITHTINKILVKDDPKLLASYLKAAGYMIGQTKTQIRSGFYNNWDDIYGSVPQATNDMAKLPGFYNILDFNADGVIKSTDDYEAFGYPETPLNNYNYSMGTSYKGFSIMFQFYGVNNVSRNIPLTDYRNSTDVLFDHVLNSWSKDNQDAPSYLPKWKATGQTIGDYWVYDGSYLRLKTAEIAYTLNDKLVKKIGLSACRFYLNGTNLWFWSNLPDDREAALTGGSAAQGAYPSVRRINLGVDLTF
jgi:TonB-linked SusC/RagA family outer membrane protein